MTKRAKKDDLINEGRPTSLTKYEYSLLSLKTHSRSVERGFASGFRIFGLRPGHHVEPAYPQFRSHTDSEFLEPRFGHRLSHARAFWGARRPIKPPYQGLHGPDPSSQEGFGGRSDET